MAYDAIDAFAEICEYLDNGGPDGEEGDAANARVVQSFLAQHRAASVILAALKEARDNMQAVHDNWSSGDLAGAVNCLDPEGLDTVIAAAEAAGIKAPA